MRYLAAHVDDILRIRWNNYINIYTDGSRDPESRRVGFGSYILHVQICQMGFNILCRVSYFIVRAAVGGRLRLG